MSFSGCEANMAPVYGGRERAPVMFRARRGSSLVEMLTAVVILVFVLMAMGSMFLLSQTAAYSKEDATATAIALRFMEEQEGRPFDEFADADLFPDTASFSNKYNATASVVSRDNFSARVRVSVEWGSVMSGGRKNVSLERVISAGGHRNVGEL
ncbi:MAG: hypothetical protein LBS53_03815 [Synergistaceae bacterium]|jgi:Tfp pilus assembly protein PilV|nr:hypothetical protein [Synergistaceae bacterium]